MASGSEVTCLTYTGDGNEKTINAMRPVNSVEIYNITDGEKVTKLRTMAGEFAAKEDIAGARTFADSLVAFTAGGDIVVNSALNVNAKVFHVRIIC